MADKPVTVRREKVSARIGRLDQFPNQHHLDGSPPNYSAVPRPVFIHRYRRADDYVVIGASTVKDRKARAAEVAEAKKDNQLGLMVAGFCGYAQERKAQS